MEQDVREKRAPLSVEWKQNLGRHGLFVINAKSNRSGNPDKQETILSLTAEQAVLLGGVLVNEGNTKLRDIR